MTNEQIEDTNKAINDALIIHKLLAVQGRDTLEIIRAVGMAFVQACFDGRKKGTTVEEFRENMRTTVDALNTALLAEISDEEMANNPLFDLAVNKQ